jgi:putative transposase
VPAPRPVRAGLAERAEEYGWSSARAHVFGEADALVDGRSAFERGIERWGAYLREGERLQEREALRRATHTGRPLLRGIVREAAGEGAGAAAARAGAGPSGEEGTTGSRGRLKTGRCP